MLGAYLENVTSTPWAWGISDCSTFCADWVHSNTGHDPMREWRGTYDSESGAQSLIEEAGGLLALFDHGLLPIWSRAHRPSVGAVGLVVMPGEDREPIEIGALFTGKRWAVRSPRGLACFSTPLDVRAIWGPGGNHR